MISFDRICRMFRLSIYFLLHLVQSQIPLWPVPKCAIIFFLELPCVLCIQEPLIFLGQSLRVIFFRVVKYSFLSLYGGRMLRATVYQLLHLLHMQSEFFLPLLLFPFAPACIRIRFILKVALGVLLISFACQVFKYSLIVLNRCLVLGPAVYLNLKSIYIIE